MTTERVGLVDWDESHLDVPDLDLVLPHNAADLDDDAYDIAAQASAAWEAAVCRDDASTPSGGSPRFDRSEQPQRLEEEEGFRGANDPAALARCGGQRPTASCSSSSTPGGSRASGAGHEERGRMEAIREGQGCRLVVGASVLRPDGCEASMRPAVDGC
jgi:hypothetical protein